jgi:hypothetical protein
VAAAREPRGACQQKLPPLHGCGCHTRQPTAALCSERGQASVGLQHLPPTQLNYSVFVLVQQVQPCLHLSRTQLGSKLCAAGGIETGDTADWGRAWH